jgi:hypothetical protein
VHEELIQLDKVTKDESLEVPMTCQTDVILQEIIEDLESALARLRGISEDLGQESLS